MRFLKSFAAASVMKRLKNLKCYALSGQYPENSGNGLSRKNLEIVENPYFYINFEKIWFLF